MEDFSKMNLEKYYATLGRLEKRSSVGKFIVPTAIGGLAGTAYGLTRKENPSRDPIHPASSTYGGIGLKAGAGFGAGRIASSLLKLKSMDSLGLSLLGGLAGGLYGLSDATKDGRPDLLLKQPGLEYPDSTEMAYQLASLRNNPMEY